MPVGFCGLPAEPAPAVPTHDPNADLVGLTFPVDTGGLGVVVGTWPPSAAYVEVDTPAGPTLRVAAQVRRSKEIN